MSSKPLTASVLAPTFVTFYLLTQLNKLCNFMQASHPRLRCFSYLPAPLLQSSTSPGTILLGSVGRASTRATNAMRKFSMKRASIFRESILYLVHSSMLSFLGTIFLTRHVFGNDSIFLSLFLVSHERITMSQCLCQSLSTACIETQITQRAR